MPRTCLTLTALAFTLATSLATSLANATTYSYEPAVVTLQGTLLSSPGETPDGEKLTFPSLRLNKPITVQAPPTAPGAEAEAEKGVVLLHMALNAKNMATFKALKGQQVKVVGTLFHADNGHHQTNVLVSPVSIERVK
ncbi:DUF4431 domain-containing protein [Variovorax sp. H27-G14]|uniref:DUF4431 domain-containing protein n=1 Tax=Variovorax sp. H27-G14 TaxID=3111914 RepID=UPI0038FCB5BE